MKGWAVVAGLFLLASPARPQAVWTTRGECSTPRELQITIAYRDETVHRTRVRVCQIERGRLSSGQASFTPFTFVGSPRDFAASAPPRRRPLEARLREADARENALVLALSVTMPGEVLLNATYAVSPTQPTRHQLTPHVLVETAIAHRE